MKEKKMKQHKPYIFCAMLILIILLLPAANQFMYEINKPYGLGQPGRIIITSCDKNQICSSWYYDYVNNINNSLFTRRFVDGIKSKASVEEAYYYTKTNNNYPQFENPQIYDGIKGNLSLSTKNVNKYALLVGVGLLYDFSLGNTNIMCDVLVNNCDFNPENIRVLIDGDATRMNIKNSIMGVASMVKPGDIVFFYFSGHGNFGSVSAEDGRITDKELGCWFNNIKTGVNIIIVIDSCHSGSMI